MRSAGTASGAEVYDLTAHRRIFSLRAGTPRAPASVEKLYTAVALLERLGPAARLRTTVSGTGSLGPGGVWHGNLYLRGGGDPTLGSQSFNAVWEEGQGATIADLAAQLASRGIRRMAGAVYGDESLFDGLRGGPASAYRPDILNLGGELGALTYDHGTARAAIGPGVYAALQLAGALDGDHVTAHAARRTAVTPSGATELAAVQSPPLSVLLNLTNLHSDDFYAETLTKQLGARFGGAGSTAAGAQVIAAVLAGHGLHPAVIDGSGLSSADSTSPQDVVTLLREIAGTSLGEELTSSLPVTGLSGTLSRRMRGTPAQGRCRAKTGTIAAVSTLAGYCQSHGGDQIALALFLDGLPNVRAHALEDRMAIAIARDDPGLP
jgi:serine-type D-Ala-D-Ala carboxypeptidase/endopeptidase (penicillin-binding protein 4)